MATNPNDKNISVRMSPGLLARIQGVAQEEHRSVNGQILWLIEQGLRATVPPRG